MKGRILFNRIMLMSAFVCMILMGVFAAVELQTLQTVFWGSIGWLLLCLCAVNYQGKPLKEWFNIDAA